MISWAAKTPRTGASNGSVNPFQTIERKDVGLTLRVKPQISENGTVRMQIFQEVSSVQAASINSATGLITNSVGIRFDYRYFRSLLTDDGSLANINRRISYSRFNVGLFLRL